jgi:hypothetical protein
MLCPRYYRNPTATAPVGLELRRKVVDRDQHVDAPLAAVMNTVEVDFLI